MTIEDLQSTLLEELYRGGREYAGRVMRALRQILGVPDQKLAVTKVRNDVGTAKLQMLPSQQMCASCRHVPISALHPR